MTTFKSWIASLSTKLPFGITFNVSPSEYDNKTTVAGFELSELNELTVSETWFFETITELNQNKAVEAQIAMTMLGAKVAYLADIEGLGVLEGVKVLFQTANYLHTLKEEATTGSPDVDKLKYYNDIKKFVESQEYVGFVAKHSDDYEKVATLSAMVQSEQSVQWVKVTFFMMSRFSGDWTFEDTSRLGTSRFTLINDFINKEVRGDVPAIESVNKEQDQETDVKKK